MAATAASAARATAKVAADARRRERAGRDDVERDDVGRVPVLAGDDRTREIGAAANGEHVARDGERGGAGGFENARSTRST